jgi:hypothetical protein
MKHGMKRCIGALVVAAGMSMAAAHGADAVALDFETRPLLSAQPDNFFDAGAMQTYTESGSFRISGGVVLGNPAFLPAFAVHGSGTNLYGTADFADQGLLDSITLTMPDSAGVTSVGGVLFNGQSIPETYVVSFFSGVTGLTPLSSQTFASMAASSDEGAFGVFSFSSSLADPITRVTITTPNSSGANGWDFFVDSLVITAVPEPSRLFLFGAGLAVFFVIRCRQKRTSRF